MQNDSDLNKVVALTRVTKAYPHEEPAVRDVSFSVSSGEFVCVIGPSGCGKSTLLKLIAGLEKPTAGNIVRPDNVSMVFQSGALFPWLSVVDNVSIGLRAQGMVPLKATAVAREYLALLGLTGFEQKYPRELSGGQRQRVGIARALAVKPSVLLLDEPFSALDPKTNFFLHEDLIKIWKETKVTVIMVSHLIGEAVALAERVVFMENGAIKQTFPITISYPRHEQGVAVLSEIEKIRRVFLAGGRT